MKSNCSHYGGRKNQGYYPSYVYRSIDELDRTRAIRTARRREEERRENLTIFFAVAAAAFVIMMVSVMAFKLTAHASETDGMIFNRHVAYKSILIGGNETLWSIADREMSPEWKDKASFIREIEKINNLNGSDIHQGSYLCIPYYA